MWVTQTMGGIHFSIARHWQPLMTSILTWPVVYYCLAKMAHLVLASSSPRRRELLQQLGLNFEIYSPDIDESVHDGELVHQYVERLAREKAQAVLNIFQIQ